MAKGTAKTLDFNEYPVSCRIGVLGKTSLFDLLDVSQEIVERVRSTGTVYSEPRVTVDAYERGSACNILVEGEYNRYFLGDTVRSVASRHGLGYYFSTKNIEKQELL